MNIRELEAQLAKAKKEAAAAELKERLGILKETVENRVFGFASAGSQRQKNPRIQIISFTRYTNIKIDSWNPNGFTAQTEALSFQTKNGIWKQTGIHHQIDKESRLGNSFDFGKEIPNAVFNQLKKSALVKSSILFEAAQEAIQTVIDINLDYLKEHTQDIELDIPHIVLEPYEAAILGESIFMLEGYRYLLTPNSIQAAKDKIYEEGINLYKGSQYYESCDWDYVTRRKESMDNILAKLNQ